MYLSLFQKFLKYGSLAVMFSGVFALPLLIYKIFLFINFYENFAYLIFFILIVLAACMLNCGLNIMIEEQIFEYRKNLTKDIPEEILKTVEQRMDMFRKWKRDTLRCRQIDRIES